MREKTKLMFLILSLWSFFSCNKEEQSPTDWNGKKEPTQAPADPTNNEPPSAPGEPPSSPPRHSKIPTISGLRWYPQNKWNPQWSKALISFVEREGINEVHLNQNDLNTLGCPSYNRSSLREKTHFWTVFLASIASQESAFNPLTRYWEAPLKEWSEGLLQLSVSNQKPSGGCAGINSATILQPIPNLRCGTHIMNRQLRGDSRRGRPAGKLFPTPAYYWSTLTSPAGKSRVIEFFKRHLNQMPFCLD